MNIFGAIITFGPLWTTPFVQSAAFRPYLFVLLAFGAAWLIIGAWIFQIARKVSWLMHQISQEPREP